MYKVIKIHSGCVSNAFETHTTIVCLEKFGNSRELSLQAAFTHLQYSVDGLGAGVGVVVLVLHVVDRTAICGWAMVGQLVTQLP